MLAVKRIHRPWSLDDLFDDRQWCPVCKGNQFTNLEGAGIWCDECNAQFEVGYTSGDPGVVITCTPPEWSYYAITRKTWTQEDRAHFWQVLKPCDDGLDGRDVWCTNLDIKDLGAHRMLYLRRDDPAMGEVQEHPVKQTA